MIVVVVVVIIIIIIANNVKQKLVRCNGKQV